MVPLFGIPDAFCFSVSNVKAHALLREPTSEPLRERWTLKVDLRLDSARGVDKVASRADDGHDVSCLSGRISGSFLC